MSQERKLTFLPGVEGVQYIPLSKLVPLKTIIPSELTNLRKLSQERVSRLVNSDESEWPPIEVAHIQTPGLNLMMEDIYIIVDGMHRHTSAQKKKMKAIASHVGSYANEDELLLAYLTANNRHGLPADKAMREAAANAMYGMDYDLTPEEISKRVGLSPLQVAHTLEAGIKEIVVDTPENEAPEQKEVRLFLAALLRFYQNQQNTLKRFMDAVEYEKDIAAIDGEIRTYYASLKPRQQKFMDEVIDVLIDIAKFIESGRP